jgi:protein-S-isoprenylcysteine O-methyltransferase Ste14
MGLVGLVGALLIRDALALGPALTPTLLIGLPATAMVVWELAVRRTYSRPSSGLDFSSPSPWRETLQRSAVKLVGLWSAWLTVGAIYRFLPFYDGAGFKPFLAGLATVAPYLFALSVPYVVLVDRYMREPRDENWHFGMLILGRRDEADLQMCKAHVLNYAIKGFFLAFMFNAFVARGFRVLDTSWHDIFANRLTAYIVLADFLRFIDIVFATIGYFLTLRVLDAQIRSPNPLLSGWVAALACYSPFAIIVPHGMLAYGHGKPWQELVAIDSVFGALMIVAILALTAIYAWSTVAFGPRFSNLTHRGIITNGPYAFTKHPAYLTKNLAFWLIWMPFVPVVGFDNAVGSCIALAGVNAIYYWRARTEEAHLMQDPVYRQYAAYIAEHGLFAQAQRVARGSLDTGAAALGLLARGAAPKEHDIPVTAVGGALHLDEGVPRRAPGRDRGRKIVEHEIA